MNIYVAMGSPSDRVALQILSAYVEMIPLSARVRTLPVFLSMQVTSVQMQWSCPRSWLRSR